MWILNISLPSCDFLTSLAQGVASIIAFPWAVEKRPVDILPNFRDLSEPHRSTATHRVSSELNREGDLCQTTSKVAWAAAKYSSRGCQSYA